MRPLLVGLMLCLVSCVPSAAPAMMGGNYYTETNQLVRWYPQDFPLTLILDSQFHTLQVEALNQAVFSWNDSLNAEVFVVSPRRVSWTSSEIYAPDSRTILVLRGDIPDTDITRTIQGQANLSYDVRSGRMFYGWVFLDENVPDYEAMLVFKHELGHILGLRHDDWAGSIMYHAATASGGRLMADDIRFVRWEMFNVAE